MITTGFRVILISLVICASWTVSFESLSEGQKSAPVIKHHPDSPGDGNYGAIAYSDSTGAWGSAYDYASQELAEQWAKHRCGAQDCTIRVWFKNACGSLAVGNGCSGTGRANSRDEAQSLAVAYCRNSGVGCTVKCWACTTRP